MRGLPTTFFAFVKNSNGRQMVNFRSFRLASGAPTTTSGAPHAALVAPPHVWRQIDRQQAYYTGPSFRRNEARWKQGQGEWGEVAHWLCMVGRGGEVVVGSVMSGCGLRGCNFLFVLPQGISRERSPSRTTALCVAFCAAAAQTAHQGSNK